jgi:hypothetical protein
MKIGAMIRIPACYDQMTDIEDVKLQLAYELANEFAKTLVVEKSKDLSYTMGFATVYRTEIDIKYE